MVDEQPRAQRDPRSAALARPSQALCGFSSCARADQSFMTTDPVPTERQLCVVDAQLRGAPGSRELTRAPTIAGQTTENWSPLPPRAPVATPVRRARTDYFTLLQLDS